MCCWIVFIIKGGTQLIIENILKDIVSEWGIQHNVVAMVTDNASNILKDVTITGWRQVRCFEYSLNLAVATDPQQEEFKCVRRSKGL